MKFTRLIATGVAAAIAATSLVACSSDNDDAIKIGTTDNTQREWDVFSDLAEKAGIDIEIVPFSDYNTPNDALAQGEIDVNKFQHLKFLAEYNKGSNANLVPIASSEIYTLALFWKDHDSLDGIEGKNVAIPNDPTNQGRAINVLVQAGLIKLKKEGLSNPTPADVDHEASKVDITPVDAAQTTVAYSEGTPAVINNAFLERAGIKATDAIFQDDPNTKEAAPYINVWVTRPDNANDERINKLAELWKDPAVEEAVKETSMGTSVAVDTSREELERILSELEAEK